MQTHDANFTKSETPQPWDFVSIYRYKGRDGVRLRYYALASFAELVTNFGDSLLLFPQRWYRSPTICMSLAALQAQWDECNSSIGKAWVASRFWTQDLACLRELCKGAGVDTPPRPLPYSGYQLPTFTEYLDGPDFDALCAKLKRLAMWQIKVEDLTKGARS